MDWNDEGLILGVRRHGESSAIIEVMTAAHGRHLGLVRQGRSKRMRPVLQPGNTVALTWRARLEEHLGTFLVEPVHLRAADLISSKTSVFGLQTLANHLRLLPERDPHRSMYDAAMILVDHLAEPEVAANLLIRFEIGLLNELGFGLDLESCAISGSREALAWVSPKTGRAVSRSKGEPWADKLLPLPTFLNGSELSANDRWSVPDTNALLDGFRLSGHFLERHVYGPRGIRPPDERAGYIRALGANPNRLKGQKS